MNDTPRSRAGDELLRAAAARLTASSAPPTPSARLGGDEFVVLAEARRPTAGPELVADRVLDAFKEPFILGEIATRP